jgi:hypothetical protein
MGLLDVWVADQVEWARWVADPSRGNYPLPWREQVTETLQGTREGWIMENLQRDKPSWETPKL